MGALSDFAHCFLVETTQRVGPVRFRAVRFNTYQQRRRLMPPDMQFLLGEMNSKLDTLIKRADEDRNATQEKLKTLTDRVQKLEMWRWLMAGAAAALGGGASFLTKLVS